MPYFVVIRERGRAWDWSLPMRRQAQWETHAAFMDTLEDEGFIVAVGPARRNTRGAIRTC
jgi:uncharacterized protein YciI